MSITGRLKKELEQMADTLQRLQSYRADVISAIDTRLVIITTKTTLNKDFKRKLGEGRRSLQNAQVSGAGLLKATNRTTVLNLVLKHYKDAAQHLNTASQLI